MDTVQDKTYEAIYYSLWEAARRYSSFTQFRVIGKSHDDRMIPMLEIGQGDACIFCVAGFSGTDGQMTDRLTRMALELCRIYECNWTVDELYEVKKLLDQTRLCIIPVVNPDGYEICRKGYNTVRNPIFRQMLKMQDVPCDEFEGNARGMDTARNFPTTFCSRKKIHQQPARSTGRPEQYYGEMIRQPAFRIELPVNSGNKEEEEREIRDLMLLPLEYIYSLVQL